MGKFFWLTFIVVAAASGILVWRYAPVLGERLPPDVRRRICAAVESTTAQFTEKGKADENGAVRPVDLADADATWGVLNCITPVEELDGKPIGNVAGGKFFLIKDTVSTPDGSKVTGTFDSKKLRRPVRIPAKNLTCFSGQPSSLSTNQQTCLSMYYQLAGEAEARKEKVRDEALNKNPHRREAAKALQQLRALESSVKKPGTADLDAQRKATYELSQLRGKVQELRQKYKDWEKQHTAELPDPEKDPAYLEILRRRQKYAEPIKGLL